MSVNLEEPTKYIKPEPEEFMTVPRKVTLEPYVPKPTPEPQTVPEKSVAPEPQEVKYRPELETPKVESTLKKTPEAPQLRGKVKKALFSWKECKNAFLNVLCFRLFDPCI